MFSRKTKKVFRGEFDYSTKSFILDNVNGMHFDWENGIKKLGSCSKCSRELIAEYSTDKISLYCTNCKS